MKTLFALFASLLLINSNALAETVSFPTSDGLEVSAELYIQHANTAPLIVLFHQAGWSRGEYIEIAPKLNAMGFNCIAVDQRSGKVVNNVINLTAQQATKFGRKTDYQTVLPDMVAAVAYAQEHHAKGKLIIWGSSYSAALVFNVAASLPSIVDGVLAFSPNASAQWTQDWILSSAQKLQQPVFITSAKREKDNWWPIYQAISSNNKSYFLPETAGNHGSRALWDRFDDSGDYWAAVKDFLNKI